MAEKKREGSSMCLKSGTKTSQPNPRRERGKKRKYGKPTDASLQKRPNRRVFGRGEKRKERGESHRLPSGRKKKRNRGKRGGFFLGGKGRRRLVSG